VHLFIHVNLLSKNLVVDY